MPEKLPRGALKAAAEALEDAGMQPGILDDWASARIALEAALPVIERSVRRTMARHILTLNGLAHGRLCPACHGKPVIVPRTYTGSVRYRCGCGHEWERSGGAPVDYRLTMESALNRAARGEPLPDLPAKSGEEGGDGH